MEATSNDADTPASTLHRVGTVLIAVGVADIAWMFYAISSGQGYSSSFNIFAVIAGVLLRRQSLRTARVVVFFSAFLFAGFLSFLLALPVVFPADLIQTYYRITPTLSALGWGGLLVGVLVLLWWVHRSLTAPPIQAAIRSSGLGPKRFWHRPRAGFILGTALVVFLAILLPLTDRSDTGREAIERARAEYGPEYRYFVSSLSTSWSSGTGKRVRAKVLVYTHSSIESVELEWRE